jgi:hypothetical protein
MNLYLKFDKNNWYDFGADDLSSVFPINNNKKEVIMKKWISDALETITRFSEPFGSF